VGLGLAAALLLRSSVTLNAAHARDPREPLVVAPSTMELRDMVAFLEDWSVRTAQDQHALSVGVQSDLGPLVGWYLRDFADLRFEPTPSAEEGYGALVLAARTGQSRPEGYVGQRFRVQARSDAPLGAAHDALAWWLMGTRGGTIERDAIELWVKSERE